MKTQRRTKTQWLALIREQAGSGLSTRQFCERRKISPNYFASVRWKYRHALAPRPSNQEPSSSPFLQIKTLNPPQNIMPPTSAIRLTSARWQLDMPTNCDPAWLGQVLRGLF
jgi:hypothetical protein